MYELNCKYDSCKSFYGKAMVKEKYNYLELYSYDTLVAYISKRVVGKVLYKTIPYLVNGKSKTQTTTRHQKEFFKQNGLDDTQIKELFKNGELELRV